MLFLTVLLVRKFESRLRVLGLGLDKQKQREKNVDSEITHHAGQSAETTVNALHVFVSVWVRLSLLRPPGLSRQGPQTKYPDYGNDLARQSCQPR